MTISVSIAPSPILAFLNNQGKPCVGGTVLTQVGGVNYPTYQDSAGATPLPNPIPLNNRGEISNASGVSCQLFLDNSAIYTFTLFDANGNQLNQAQYVAPSSNALVAFIASIASSIGASLIGFIQAGVGAVLRTVQNKLRGLDIDVEDFGAMPGAADNTAAINLAIIAAYKSATTVSSPFGEIYSIRVRFQGGKDYNVLGKILLPSQVILAGNGCRLIGPSGSAGSTVYSGAGQQMIETAYYDGTNLVSNGAAADETTWRVVGAGVEGITFANTNCAINAINMQEQSMLDGLRFGNVSAPMRLKNCFYLRVGKSSPFIIRNSALAATQPAILLHGVAAHAMDFDGSIIGAAIGYEITATNSFSVDIEGSIEEGYAINSIGIRANNAYCQSWKVHAYMEGVRVGITTLGTGAFFASFFTPSYFSGCEYAMQALTSSFRACTLDCASIPDEGAGIHNYVDLQAANNDVRVRMPSKTRNTSQGVQPFPSNYLLGPGSVCDAASAWVQTSNAAAQLGLGDGALVNKSSLAQLPFEGRQLVTVSNEVPFMTLSAVVAGGTGGSITLDSLIVADASDILVVNLTVQDFNGTYIFQGFIFGTTVYWPTPPTKTMTVSAMAGFKRFVIGGLNTTSYAVQGVIRHP